MTEPCPRGCGKPSKPRHTCIDQPDSPEADRPYGGHLREVMFASVALRRLKGHSAGHCKKLAEDLESGRLRIVEAGTETELEEARRKAGHYHAQRGEADERIAELESWLAECYRQSGADPDGNEDWRLAHQAVGEVTHMRVELDEADERNAKLEDALEQTTVALKAAMSAFSSIVHDTGDKDYFEVVRSIGETTVAPALDRARGLLS